MNRSPLAWTSGIVQRGARDKGDVFIGNNEIAVYKKAVSPVPLDGPSASKLEALAASTPPSPETIPQRGMPDAGPETYTERANCRLGCLQATRHDEIDAT